LQSKYLDDVLGAVENVVSVIVEEPTKVKTCQEEPDLDIKAEPVNDSPLMASENSICSTELADKMQSSEQDDCKLEADGTDTEEVTDSLTVDTPVQLSQRKRVRQCKSGLKLCDTKDMFKAHNAHFNQPANGQSV